MEEIYQFLNEISVSSDDPQFFKKIFYLKARKIKRKSPVKNGPFYQIVSESYASLSDHLDKSKFQESCSVRNVLRTRYLANLLINDEGEINLSAIPSLLEVLKAHAYSLGPERQFDALRQEHIIHVLESLAADKNLQRQLKGVSRPYSHKVADQIIRDALALPSHFPVSDVEARRACLSAWLCYLRQNVGSCFATAPAIVVQQEQPELFLRDINELLNTGRLKRTFGGIEYAVPLSSSWGAGDLRKLIPVDGVDEKAIDDLALSPGLLAALEQIEMVPQEKSLQEKTKEGKVIIRRAIRSLLPKQAFSLISAEEILRSILLTHYQITEKDLEEYANRPRGMMHTSLIMIPSKTTKTGSKGEACQQFLTRFEIAKNGFKSLADNALLKTWEFSLASFAETKPAFTRWNMYASLGFNMEDKGGIGDFLYHFIKEKLDQVNRKMQDWQIEYEQAFSVLKYLETRLRTASTEKEMQWLKIDFEARRSEFRTLEELRNREHYKAERFANLFNDILGEYDALFPRYFQEVYDPDMHEISSNPYDDSPAGFRLIYKYGRDNTSQWKLIYTPQEFIEALSSFFVASETELVKAPLFEGLEEDISDLVTRLIMHVKTDLFLESAFYRMAKAHQAPLIKDPLNNLDKIDKKPWAYTSGGTMSNLMSCYFRLEGKPVEQGRWVENEMELLVFLIDTVKQMPANLSEEYLKTPSKSLLMHSPTHAFTLKPGFPLFKESVHSETYSYIWVRDQLLRPRSGLLNIFSSMVK